MSTSTGKICTRCRKRNSQGWLELSTMCVECFETSVVAYFEAQLNDARIKLRDVQDHIKLIELHKGNVDA